MGGERRLEQVAVSGGQRAMEIPAMGDDPRLVQSGPHRDPVTQGGEGEIGVIGEPIGDIGVEPPAPVVERGGKIPVVERGHRLDVRGDQRIDQPPVEVDAALIPAAFSIREHAAPRDAEAIRLQTERLHQRHIVTPAVVVVAGDEHVGAIRDAAGLVAEGVPDRAAARVGTLDLCRAGGRAPLEARAERR